MADEQPQQQTQNPKQQEEQIKKIVEQVVQEQMQKTGQGPSNGDQQPDGQKDQQMAVDCTNVHNVGLQVLNYCIEQTGNLNNPENLKTIRDCVELAALTNSFIIRQSNFKNDILKICHTACDLCAKLADKFSEDDQMKALAEYAHKAADSTQVE